MNNPETLCMTSRGGIRLEADWHKATHRRKNTAILYFHGGGLLFGIRRDLPEPYVRSFLEAGYDFFALDYPLAPEAPLEVILSSALELAQHCLAQPALAADRYLLFGRSAGAYLALQLCELLRRAGAPPSALLCLYGYAGLTGEEFCTPSRHYLQLPAVPEAAVWKMSTDGPVVWGPLTTRLALYIKSRQEGSWSRLLCGSSPPEDYSLSAAQLQSFPPAFLAAATMDPDVPYRHSKELSRQIPGSHLSSVYLEAHDFDRDPSGEAGRQVYQEMLHWLEHTL